MQLARRALTCSCTAGLRDGDGLLLAIRDDRQQRHHRLAVFRVLRPRSDIGEVGPPTERRDTSPIFSASRFKAHRILVHHQVVSRDCRRHRSWIRSLEAATQIGAALLNRHRPRFQRVERTRTHPDSPNGSPAQNFSMTLQALHTCVSALSSRVTPKALNSCGTKPRETPISARPPEKWSSDSQVLRHLQRMAQRQQGHARCPGGSASFRAPAPSGTAPGSAPRRHSSGSDARVDR